MKRLPRILAIAGISLLLIFAWLVWSRPNQVDMSAYAPADSLLYIEANDPVAVVQALTSTDAWRLTRAPEKSGWVSYKKGWLSQFFRATGVGPIQSVVLSRAQVAVVVTDLGSVEEGDTLTVKPELALIIETHTSQARIRGPAEEALKTLAQSTYVNPTLRRTLINGVEFVEWRNQEGSRQVVFTIVGSMIVIGNSEKAVQKCLDSAGRRLPSLKDDSNLQLLRRNLAGTDSLTFGYVPQAKSAHLLSVAVPLLLGRAPGDSGFQKLVSTGAAKIFGSIAWSSRPFRSGIEDRYLIALQPSLLTPLKPVLQPTSFGENNNRIIPERFYSATFYKLDDPLAAWQGLRTAVSASVDTLSAVVFSSLLKSALLSYGISDPEAFLSSVTGEIETLRLDAAGDHSLVIARVKDHAALREAITQVMKFKLAAQDEVSPTREIFVDEKGEMGVSLDRSVVIVGSGSDVRNYHDGVMTNVANSAEKLKRVTFYTPISGSGSVVTYTDDRERVRRFNSAVNSIFGSSQNEIPGFEESLSQLPFAATETKVDERGFERTTRSPLGQFSTLLPLSIPNSVNSRQR